MTADYAGSAQGREGERLMTLVRAAMVEQRVSQSELARRSGYARSHVSMLLNDRDDGSERREASVSTALHLAYVLGVVRIVGDA